MAAISNPFSPDFTTADNGLQGAVTSTTTSTDSGGVMASSGADVFDLLGAPTTTPEQSKPPAAMTPFPLPNSQEPLSAFDRSMSSPTATNLNMKTNDDDYGDFGGPMGGSPGGLNSLDSRSTFVAGSTMIQTPPPLPQQSQHSNDATATGGLTHDMTTTSVNQIGRVLWRKSQDVCATS